MISDTFKKLLRAPGVIRTAHACRDAIQQLGQRLQPEGLPRRWSNSELRRFGPLFTGDIVNVSGWRDEDRGGTGGRYADYFPNKRSYAITNYSGSRGAFDTGLDQIPLDLEAGVPTELRGHWDVVLSHTTLEHVLDLPSAACALADLTRDIIIVVVPFMQEQHYDEGSYGDYWRFTPMALAGLFARLGFEALYISANDQPWFPIYVFYIGSRQPERWRQSFPKSDTASVKIGRMQYPWK